MSDIMKFAQALESTDGQKRNLILGNGFSSDYFNYSNLLEAAEIAPGSPLRRLFKELQTVDFEEVLSAINNAIIVEKAYDNSKRAKELEEHAAELRNCLVKAVNAIHPQHREELVFKYEYAASFIANFKSVFTLNYDLLLYWVRLDHLKTMYDGFGKGDKTRENRFIGPFDATAYCNVYNLHGGLHLFEEENGDLYKALNDGAGVMSTIKDCISGEGRLPLYVSEGSSTEKLQKIKASKYLSHSLSRLESATGPVFVFGHSASENDKHIYDAIFKSGASDIYFGVFDTTEEGVAQIKGQLSRFKNVTRSNINYHLFDSKSAHVWDDAL